MTRTRRVLGGIAVLTLAALLSGCGGAQSRFASHMHKGQSYFATGDFAKANVEFRNALQISPRNPEAAVMVGRSFESLGRFREAAALYQYVVDNAPDNLEARAHLARLLALAGAPERALKIVEPALARHPEDATLLTVRAFARAHLAPPDAAGALADIDHALRVAPANEEAVALRARMYSDAGDYGAAATLVNGALREHPHSTDLREILAGLYNAAGEPDKAEAQLQELVRAQPHEAKFRYELAQFYQNARRNDDAQRVLEAAVHELNTDQARLRLVGFLTRTRGAAQGEQALRGFVARDPGDLDLQLALAELLTAAQPQAARAVYQEVIHRDGTGAKGLIARDRIASLALQQGHEDEARKLIAEVLQQNPRDNDALSLRGALALSHGDLPAAIADFRAVLRDQPGNAGVHRLLARAYLASGEPVQAEDSLRAAVDLTPADPAMRLELAQLLLQTRRTDQAIDMLEGAVRGAPNDVSLRAGLVRAYLAKPDYSAARHAAEDLKRLRPEAPVGYYLAGVAAQGQKQWDDARAELTHALALQPQALDALTALAELEVSRGNQAGAVKLLNDAFERDRGNAFPLNLLGEVYLQQNNIPQAIVALTRASEVAPTWWPPYRNLALAHEAAGDTGAAIAAYQTSIKLAPAVPKLVIELSRLYEHHGRVDDAIACYDVWLQRNPGVPVAANNLAMLLVTYKSDAASLNRARDLTARFATTNDGSLLDTTGWVYLKRGEYAQALPVLERAAERAPDSREIRYHLAIAELHSGQTERARSNLEAALAGTANFAGADDARTQLAALTSSPSG